jgi:hypothetical protein
MHTWLRRARAAVGMGFAWAVAGALVGGLFELVDNVLPGVFPFIRRVDMWPQTLAIPGFLGGILFSLVLGIVGRRRRFAELSLPQFAAWGAVAGALLGGYALANGAPAYFIGIATLGSAIAAPGSLALARMAEKRDLLNAREDTITARFVESEAREALEDKN